MPAKAKLLAVLQFVKAKRAPRSGYVYGYISDIDTNGEWIEVRYHNGIKPTTEMFAPNQVQGIDEDTFDMKTESQTALHSCYWDDKEKTAESVPKPVTVKVRPLVWKTYPERYKVIYHMAETDSRSYQIAQRDNMFEASYTSEAGMTYAPLGKHLSLVAAKVACDKDWMTYVREFVKRNVV